MAELMEMSNLPQYSENWGDMNSKEKAPTHYMAAIIQFFLKQEMSGSAPNIGTLADAFKVSQSQLSWLITVKKFRSGPSGYMSKRCKMVMEGETSGAGSRKMEEQEMEGDALENYLLQ